MRNQMIHSYLIPIELPTRPTWQAVWNRAIGSWLPGLLAVYGFCCMALGHKPIGGRVIPLGLDRYALSFGILCVSIASLLRCRCVWSDRTRLSLLVMFVEDLSLMAFICALLYILVSLEMVL